MAQKEAGLIWKVLLYLLTFLSAGASITLGLIGLAIDIAGRVGL